MQSVRGGIVSLVVFHITLEYMLTQGQKKTHYVTKGFAVLFWLSLINKYYRVIWWTEMHFG